jgi:hypothetical protein
MGDLVERADLPPAAVANDEPGHGAVVVVDECKRPAPGRLPEDLPDHASVEDRDGDGVGTRHLDDPFDPGSHTALEGVGRLGAGDDIPPLVHEHLPDERVAPRDADPVLASFPVAKPDLRELFHDNGLEAGRVGERSGRLVRAPQRRHEETRDPFADERVGDCPRLLETLVRQVRVAAAVDEREARAGEGDLGRAVTDDDDLGGAFGQAERPLLVSAGVDRCVGTAQGFTSTLIDSSFLSWTVNASPMLSSGFRWVISGSDCALPVLNISTASRKSSLV